MTTEAVAAIVGALLPILIAFVKQAHYPNQVNAAIAVVVYFIVGIATLLVSGQAVNAQNLVVDIGIVTTAGTAAYSAFWKNFDPASQPEPPVVTP